MRNEGVAFSRFSGGGTIVAVIVGAALVALLAYFVTHLDKPLVWLPTGMLLGGALGNVIDRIRDGAVTDFIKLPGGRPSTSPTSRSPSASSSLLYVTERPRNAAAKRRLTTRARGSTPSWRRRWARARAPSGSSRPASCWSTAARRPSAIC